MANRVKKAQKGFSLIEMVVVLAIMAILVTIVISSYLAKPFQSSKTSACLANLRVIDGAIRADYALRSAYPGSLGALLADGYLNRVPEEPFGGSYDLSPGGEYAVCSLGHTY